MHSLHLALFEMMRLICTYGAQVGLFLFLNKDPAFLKTKKGEQNERVFTQL